MQKLLQKLRARRARKKMTTDRLGIPRSTFNAVAEHGEAILHEKYAACLQPKSTIVVFPMSDTRPDAPTLTVTVTRDALNSAMSVFVPETKMRLVRTSTK